MKKKNWFYLILLLTFVALLWGVVYYVRPCTKCIGRSKLRRRLLRPFPRPRKKQNCCRTAIIIFSLYGVDAGEWVKGSYRPGKGRADTIVLLQLDLEERTVAMLSIPRDTLVEIPGYAGTDKINHAYAFGGSELLLDTVEQFTGIPVDYYLEVNYTLFRDVVDALGGLEFEVDRTIKARGLTLEPGLQHLDGDQAFALVSFRYEPMGDIARVKRQQRFLLALARQVKERSVKELLPVFYAGWKHVKTNLTPEEGAELVVTLNGLQIAAVHTEVVPAGFITAMGLVTGVLMRRRWQHCWRNYFICPLKKSL